MIAALLLATGVAEATFPAGPPTTIAVQIAAGCIDKGWLVVSQAENQVLCEHEADPMVSLENIEWRGRLIPKRGYARFIVLPQGEGVRVQISAYTQWSTPFGQMRQEPSYFTTSEEKLLETIGGTVIKGQTAAK